MLRPVALVVVLCTCLGACDRKDPDTPDPGDTPPGTVQAAPGDRLAWTQPAPDASDIAAIQFALYVDGIRTTLTGAGCARAGASFECSAVLPTLTAGTHTLELAAFVGDSGLVLESARSAPLQVLVVARANSSFTASSIAVATLDQTELTLTPVTEELDLPSDIAFATDGSVFVAERRGIVRVIRNGVLVDQPALDLSGEVQLPAGGLLALALDPDFDENGFVYALYAAAAPRNGQEFMLARFRAVNGVFGERAVLLDRTPASPYGASGALRIGGDGKLYVALDSWSDMGIAGSYASYNGKVLRLNLDATTPEDWRGQPPIFSFDHPQPQAIDWQPSTGTLWVVDRLGADAGRLSAIPNGARQTHLELRTSYALAAGTGAASATFYRGALIPSFQGDLFVAAETGRELMRLRFDPTNLSRIISVERLLKDQIGPVRLVAEGKDGALYVATENAMYRLGP